MLQTSFIYNPANQSKEDLINNFVIRKKEFEKIFYDLKNSEMKNPEQHYIIQGQRGYGKTTLLLRLYHEINKDPETNKKYIPIIFKEEQYNIRTLEKLWEYIAECLEESNFFTGIVSEMESKEELENAEEEYFAILEKTLKKNDKKIILLIDNIGDILNKFRPKETQRLREVLLTTAEIRIIGASSVVLEHTYDYSKPFFEFFKIIKLNGLNSEETIKLLLKLGENNQKNVIQNIIKNEPERIESLRRLTGGVPRTIVLLFEIFTDDKDGSSFKDLEKILDLVTPLYKHRMDDLSPIQQNIADTIAMAWDAVSTKYISEKVKMESKVVSAQLKELEKNNIVLKINTSKKNHLYQISERFFNIWYLMRYGRKKDQERVKWLVEFLEIWCNKDELGNRVEKHIKALKEGTLYERHALFMTEALARTEIDKEKQHELIECTRDFFKQNNSELLNELSSSDYEIFKDIREAIKHENFNLVLELYKKLKKDTFIKQSISFFEDVLKNKPTEIFQIGVLYENTNEVEKAEKYYKKTLNLIDKNYIDLVFIYELELKTTNIDLPIARKYYLEAIEKSTLDDVKNLAYHYLQNKDYEKAEKYLLIALDKGCISSYTDLGIIYEKNFKDYKNAEKYYLMGVDKNNTDSIYNLAQLYKKQKKYDLAEKYYLLSIDKEYNEALIDLGYLYEKKDDWKKAEEYFLIALEKGVFGASTSLALLYEEKEEALEKIEKYYLISIDKNQDVFAMCFLAVLYYENEVNKEKALELVMEAQNKNIDTYLLQHILLVLLWNNKIIESMEIFSKLVKIKKNIKYRVYFKETLLHFIAKKQYNYTFELFQDETLNFKNKYKPIYYALMYFMQDKYPDEYLKMGAELKETVEEIINRINQMAIDYK